MRTAKERSEGLFPIYGLVGKLSMDYSRPQIKPNWLEKNPFWIVTRPIKNVIKQLLAQITYRVLILLKNIGVFMKKGADGSN